MHGMKKSGHKVRFAQAPLADDDNGGVPGLARQPRYPSVDHG